jgi:hypothetical protein
LKSGNFGHPNNFQGHKISSSVFYVIHTSEFQTICW